MPVNVNLYAACVNYGSVNSATKFHVKLVIVSSLYIHSFFRPFGFIASKTLNYLVFQSFDFEHT